MTVEVCIEQSGRTFQKNEGFSEQAVLILSCAIDMLFGDSHREAFCFQ